MRLTVIYTLCLLALVSCGKGADYQGQIDPEAQVYVDRFERNLGPVSKSLTVIYKDLSPTDEGQVQTYALCAGGGNYIYIDANRWANLDDNQREFVIMHELGHCVLNRMHVDTVSFMRPQVPRSDYFKPNRTAMYKEMFGEESEP